MSKHDFKVSKSMPAPAPLAMPTQDFSRWPGRPSMEQAPAGTHLFRWATFLPAIATVLVLLSIFLEWFRKGGFMPAEIALLALVAFSAFWIALSVSAATIGLFARKAHPHAPDASALKALNVALLVPVYNEDPLAVFRRLTAIRCDLAVRATHHRFAIFVLSDTRDEAVAKAEQAQFAAMRACRDDGIPIFYRRRADNSERKTGNIRDWIETWGGAWDAFVTLDADSLMSGSALTELADKLAERPRTALIQTVPRLLEGKTVFARVQQFANNIYGGVLARGLERWCGPDGNYWGHNAIIRTKAFAQCCGLPRLRGKGALSGTIKSHDFVEAALLRRGGWSVDIEPDMEESYEEIPQSIVDYVLRDRRWCQGNLQHLRLLGTRGFTAASRFHMVQGAMAYVASLVWFVLLILFTLMGKSEEETVFRYFTETNPLFPQWPEADIVSRTVVLAFVLGLLVLPKFFGLVSVVLEEPSLASKGGPVRFFLSALLELAVSVLLAPIMMIQHVVAITRTFVGRDTGWSPQNRGMSAYPLSTLIRFHALETLIGILLFAGMAAGVVSIWLVPIAGSLLFAVPISWISSLPLSDRMRSLIMLTREDIAPCRVVRLAYDDIVQASSPAPKRRSAVPKHV